VNNEGENLAEPTAEDKEATENVDDELHGEDDEVDDGEAAGEAALRSGEADMVAQMTANSNG
jgi:transcription factor SPN1